MRNFKKQIKKKAKGTLYAKNIFKKIKEEINKNYYTRKISITLVPWKEPKITDLKYLEKSLKDCYWGKTWTPMRRKEWKK